MENEELYKHSLREMEAWKTVDFNKQEGGCPVDLRHVHLLSLYNAPREISHAKFDDLMQFRSYVQLVHHGFYHSPNQKPLFIMK